MGIDAVILPNAIFEKDPAEVKDFTRDWNDDGWLGSDDEIDTSEWTVPTGLTKDSDQKTATTTTIMTSGGTDGQDYTCGNTVTTTGGRTGRWSILVRVRKQ